MPSIAILDLASADYRKIVRHVLPLRAKHEEAAFIFARADDAGVFTPIEVQLVQPAGFVHRSPFYLELTDETRQGVIKRGHDLGASIIEMHSHPSQLTAAFSPSDRRGFYEFVPHLLWRLRKRPYAAVVLAKNSFDSLAWFESVDSPVQLTIRLDGKAMHKPTGITHSTWGEETKDDE